MSSPPVPLRAILAASTASVSPHSSTSTTAQTSIASTSPTTSANTSPFFPEPSTLHPLPDPQAANRELARNIVGYLVLALVLLVILFLLCQRFLRLRRTNQPLAHFFHITRSRPSRRSSGSIHASSQSTITLPTPSYPRPRLTRPHYDLDYDATYQNSSVFDDVRYPITASEHLSRDLRHIPLSNYPYMHYSGTRRTRAAGVDDQGRRLDSGRDPDLCSVDDKDMLPAYDRHGGPPTYLDPVMGSGEVMQREHDT